MSTSVLHIPTASATADESGPRIELRHLVEQLEATTAAEIHIYTRSRYLTSSWERWQGWAANDWRTSVKRQIKHADLWQRLQAACAGKHLTFTSGDPKRVIVIGSERTNASMREFARLIIDQALAGQWQLVTSDKPGFQRELLAQAVKRGVGVIQPRTVGEACSLASHAYAAFRSQDKGQTDPRLAAIKQHIPTYVLTF